MSRTERIVEFTPAFDKRHADPSKDYGIHGVELRFMVKGDLGAVQFVVYTNWQLPHVTEDSLRSTRLDPVSLRVRFLPLPADLGYHSPTPRHDGQTPVGDDCAVLGGRCYYDGSSLNAEPVFERLLREGDAGVWAALEEFYSSVFGERVPA